jgi:hypothetical protein
VQRFWLHQHFQRPHDFRDLVGLFPVSTPAFGAVPA